MKSKLRSIFAIVIIVLMAFLLVSVVLLQGAPASGRSAVQGQGAGPEDEEIGQLRALLARQSLSDEARRGLEEKLVMAERLAAQRAGTGEMRSTKVAPTAPLAAHSQAVFEPALEEEAIFEGSEGLIRPSLADIHNLWQGSRNGQDMQVFAGQFSETLGGAGVVIVIDLDPNKPTGSLTTYPAPEGTGALRIVEVQATVVILSSESGDRLTFDLSSRSFD